MTYPMLTAQDISTTQIPSYTISANSVTTGNIVYTVSAANVITQNNYPLPLTAFYAYLPIYIAVLSILLVILFMYILQWTADTVENDIHQKG